MSWNLVAGLKKLVAQETGTRIFAPGLRTPVAFLYPNTYKLGMSNLGLHILYQVLNDSGVWGCERFFLPGKHELAEYTRTRTPLLSLETQRALAEFPYVCVMMSFELDYTNFLTMLQLGRISLRAAERQEQEPLVIMGGPCATFNPEPLAPFVDVFVLGEGEETLPKLLQVLQEGRERRLTREELLVAAAQVPGVYVPRFYTPAYTETETGLACSGMQVDPRVPTTVSRQWVRELDRYPHTSAIITRQTEFAGMYIVEVARGCGRHCRFCMAGYCFRKPRNRNLQNLWQDIAARPAAATKVGLMGAAVSDYPEMRELTRRLSREQIAFSVASLRADTLNLDLAQALAASGQRTMTIAPEAGSVPRRAAINKGIEAEHVYEAVRLAAAAGMANIKLYFMIGLPGEDEDDILAITEMVHQVRQLMDQCGNKGELVVSVNAFVPKPWTPYQWSGLAPLSLLKRRFAYLNSSFKKDPRIKLITESLKETELQALLSRGNRQVGEALGRAFREQLPFKKALQAAGFQADVYAHRQLTPGQVLPWSHLQMGVTEAYLRRELERSEQGLATPKCFEGCHRCGVCQ
ncbi:MAG: radical SAM protein [Acidaminococcaceae bacterium]|nr:radical SAM protein [Acidaminococcaceae bacterium]